MYMYIIIECIEFLYRPISPIGALFIYLLSVIAAIIIDPIGLTRLKIIMRRRYCLLFHCVSSLLSGKAQVSCFRKCIL